MAKQLYIDFDAYIRQGEPAQKDKAYAWSTAIGLQAVDGLTTSEYLQQTAKRNIEGEITIDEAQELIKSYYITKNCLILNPPEEYKEQPRFDTPTSTPASTPTSLPEQVPEQVGNQFVTDNDNIKRLVMAIGDRQMSVKEMMGSVGLKDRKNFLEYSLNTAINGGWVRMLHPESPHHPRQKYLLTVKGLGLYNQLVLFDKF